MFDILDRMRSTTVADLDNVSGSFDDLPRGHFKAAKRTGMTRIVEGADDLISPRGSGNGRTMSAGRPAPSIPVNLTTDHNGERCDNPRCCPQDGPIDPRSPGQINFMASLMDQLEALDHTLSLQARIYTANMTDNGRWTRNQGQTKGTISTWIDRLKAKIAELEQIDRTVPVAIPALPIKMDKNGKPMALYYAVGPDDDAKFYRIKPGRKDGFWFIDAQASDKFHSIRSAPTKGTIISAILDAGPDECMARYGQIIGRCGRCGRTLTDAQSRARGIGPDCLGKM